MIASFSRSWKFAKMSYAMIWLNKRLIIFPLVSTFAAVLVSISFFVPLWTTGLFERWAAAMGEDAQNPDDVLMYGLAFLFYFCNYFVIVFFNTGLLACVLKIASGEKAPVSYGFAFAGKRLPQIFGWALVSAVVGVILKAIEQNKKGGRFISAILGSGWTALTFFVIPVITVEGLGPIQAFKRSSSILRQTWGTALTGNFSLGIISFLTLLPVLLISGLLIGLGVTSGSVATTIALIGLAVFLVLLSSAVCSAAGMVFKSYLYSYATGKTLPENVNRAEFSNAFTTAK
ncbi:MAG: hypothetical protein JJU29_21475 [Verrucomicrobia bacterium]|nr:hypothetical protein [Verrucomicrobiota bacterium]MCH8512209.1 DUF6159 family protein [Kiritimatiellia bacterium]